MVNLEEAQALLVWMKDNRVTHARIGELELHLDELPTVEVNSPPILDELIKPPSGNPYEDPDLYGVGVPMFRVKPNREGL